MSIDLEIARAATLKPIAEIAGRAGIRPDALDPYGKHIAKLDQDSRRHRRARADG